MKNKLAMFPTALQHQMLIQTVLALLSLVLALVVFIIFSAAASIPFLIVSLLLAFSILRLYYITTQGRYLELRGVILKVERTPIRQRPKSLLLEVDRKALRLMLRNRHLSLKEGHTIILYLADTTPLYEWHGVHQLHSYLALVPEQQGQRA